MIIRAVNQDTTKAPKTFISTAVASGATAITIKNTSGFSSNDYIQIGETGAEKTELVQATTVTPDTSFTTAALKFPHGVDTPIYRLLYNKIRFYRSTNGGVSYSLLTTVDITPDSKYTIYNDTTAIATYYFKTCFYNSTTSTESQFSGVLIATGYTTYSLKVLQDKVLTLYPDKEERLIKREDITDWLNEKYLELQSDLKEADQGFFQQDNTSSPGSLTVDVNTITLPSGFVNLKKLQISYDGTTYYRANYLDMGFDSPTTQFVESEPVYSFEGNTIVIRPTPTTSSGKYKIWYDYWDELSDPTDELDTSLRPFKSILIWHALGMACYAGNKDTRGDRFITRADKLQVKLINRAGRRHTDSTRKIELEDTGFLEVEDLA